MLAPFTTPVPVEKAQLGGEVGRHDPDDDDFEDKPPPTLPIRLNPRPPSSGRPKLDLKQRQFEERQSLARFNAAEAHRRELGDVTLAQLAKSLAEEKPSVAQALARVAPIPTKHMKAVGKRPKFNKQADPVLCADAFYILPEKLLDRCMQVLPLKNTNNTAITVEGHNQPAHGQHMDDNGQDMDDDERDADIDCFIIADVGTFSREQIEAMHYLLTLKKQCEVGLDFCTCLRQDVTSAVPPSMQSSVGKMADTIAKLNPRATMKISSNNEYHYAMMYNLRPPEWANDALILAVCERLCSGTSAVHLLGIASAVSSSRRAPHQKLSDHIKDRALAQSDEARALLVPVNFGNVHWCDIIADLQSKRILYYDSMNGKNYQKALDQLGRDLGCALQSKTSDTYQMVSLNSPLQFDGYNCGFFVCLKFWHFVDPTLQQNMSPAGMLAFRFRLLQLVLTGDRL